MKKTITCKCCNGVGKQEIDICDNCGGTDNVGKLDIGGFLCQSCWIETLTDKDIEQLL